MLFEGLFGQRSEEPKFDQKKLLLAEARNAAHLMNQAGGRTRPFVFGWARYLVSHDQIDEITHVQIGLVMGGTIFVYRITEGRRAK